MTVVCRAHGVGEDAGAPVSDQQMRPADIRYPVDRYLVESGKKFDMVKIIDDDIWNSEPALRPEDEIILRKLHDMLQSTADDLKLLSGELSTHQESDIQKKTLPTPLDEEFNEKVHIEEVVNARFHGNKPIQPNQAESTPRKIQNNLVDVVVQSTTSKRNNKQLVHHGVQVHQAPILKKSTANKNLGVSRTNLIQISKPIVNKLLVNNNEKTKKNNNRVTYNEFAYAYVEPKPTIVKKPLQIQKMPSISIRSELKEQKVLQLDIHPNSKETHTSETAKCNALVVEIKHKDTPTPAAKKPITFDKIMYIPPVPFEKPTTRKVSRMSACESESTNNVSSESQGSLRKKMKNSITFRALQRPSQVVIQKHKKNLINKKEVKQEGTRNLDEWHNKLNAVYGGISKLRSSGVRRKKIPKKLETETSVTIKQTKQVLNNAEYIPYSKLTIGGINASDIEREISDIPNKGEIVLSPILDKILSSRENSFHQDSPRKTTTNKILTTSDEDLLQEVLDIEKELTKSSSTKNGDSNSLGKDHINKESNHKDGDSYDDDFEDEKSYDSKQANQSLASKSGSSVSVPPNCSNRENNYDPYISHKIGKDKKDSENIHNKTYTKTSNLSFKNTVDIFEFIHSVDTQDIATQSNATNKVTNQENQTSSSDDKSNVQPIRNVLWPSIDPCGEVEKMFKLEKEFIKKLIIDEYGDLLEKKLHKPSTSKNLDNSSEKNVSHFQKNTQTSPAHVKSVMTSPTRTKTRTTSPFVLSQPINHQNSPIVTVSKEEDIIIDLENEEDLSISVNLSSPRFSLRLPQTTREALSKIKSEKSYDRSHSKINILQRNAASSSSSGAEDYSSSDISSLGQIHNMNKRRIRRSRISSISEISSSSSSLSRYSRYGSNRSGVFPLGSEGEASIGQMNNPRKISNKQSRSEGEVSLGQVN